MFFSCLLVSCDAGEKKMDEPVRIKVAEVEISEDRAGCRGDYYEYGQ